MSRQELFTPYRWTVVAVGSVVTFWCVNRLPLAQLDWRFLLLALVTVGISSRIAVKIPRYDTNITVSDTFVFLALLSYGGEAAVILAAAEGVVSGCRISKRRSPSPSSSTRRWPPPRPSPRPPPCASSSERLTNCAAPPPSPPPSACWGSCSTPSTAG